MKTVVVTDSTAYIPEEIREQYNIQMVSLNVIFGSESFQEEAELSAEQFYEKIKLIEELPKTSQPAIGSFIQLYEELAREYDEIVSIHLSSGISGTFQSSMAAGNMVENAKVYTYDSEISCMPQGFYVLEAARLAKEGKGGEEIIARLEEMKESMRGYFMADDLSHLQRGGRLNGASALVGSILQIKPILHFEDKKIVPFEKIRTKKRALKRLVELLDEPASLNKPMKASVIHANNEAEAIEWMNELSEQYPHIEFTLSYFGPVIGTHLGEGALGLGWYVI